MKKIFLIRHAKTEKTSESGKDFDRALKTKGIAQSHWLRGYFSNQYFTIKKVYASPAKRTTQTAEIIFSNKFIDIEFFDDLYNGSTSDYKKLIETVPEEIDHIVIVGHNPGISDFAYYLTGEPENLSTSQCLIIDFTAESWKTIGPNSGIIEQNFTPDVVDLP